MDFFFLNESMVKEQRMVNEQLWTGTHPFVW